VRAARPLVDGLSKAFTHKTRMVMSNEKYDLDTMSAQIYP
jgi:hypothetical protein